MRDPGISELGWSGYVREPPSGLGWWVSERPRDPRAKGGGYVRDPGVLRAEGWGWVCQRPRGPQG